MKKLNKISLPVWIIKKVSFQYFKNNTQIKKKKKIKGYLPNILIKLKLKTYKNFKFRQKPKKEIIDYNLIHLYLIGPWEDHDST